MLLVKSYSIGFTISTPSKSFIPFSACACSLRLFLVAMTCLFIGSKIEEEMRPVPVVIRVFYRIYQRRTGQEITKLTETDPVHFQSVSWVRFSCAGVPFSLTLKSSFSPHLDITYTASPILPSDTFCSSSASSDATLWWPSDPGTS